MIRYSIPYLSLSLYIYIYICRYKYDDMYDTDLIYIYIYIVLIYVNTYINIYVYIMYHVVYYNTVQRPCRMSLPLEPFMTSNVQGTSGDSCVGVLYPNLLGDGRLGRW